MNHRNANKPKNNDFTVDLNRTPEQFPSSLMDQKNKQTRN